MTSVKVARQFLEEVGGSIDAAVIVSGESWHDAVVAPGLAGKLNAPVLLTPPDRLLTITAEFLAEAGVSRTFVIGSPQEVSHTVLGRLARFGSVERIWGSSPEATSVVVARRMGTPGVLAYQGTTAFLASSEKVADALVAGPASFRGRHPVLLSPPHEVHPSVVRYLRTSDVEEILVLGGAEALSEQVRIEVPQPGVGYLGKGGTDRTQTSVGLARYLNNNFPRGPDGRKCFHETRYGLADAWDPIHALSAAPLLGQRCTTLLLTSTSVLSPAVSQVLRHDARSLLVFGPETSVSSQALGRIIEGAALQGVFDTAAAERERAARSLTRAIDAGTYGVDDGNVLGGPAGFSIDLSDCPDGWSDTAGITSDEIRIGLTLPKSGQYVTQGKLQWGMQVYFDWVNRTDPVAGRRIELVGRDDGFDPSRTATQVDSLIDDENVFSVLTVGTPTSLAVYDRINDACVPHPFVMSGHPAWGDPLNHPWTTGMQLSFTTEAMLWGEWIERRFAGRLPVTVAAVVSDDELGTAYLDGFAAWARSHPDVISGTLAVRIDPGAEAVDAEVVDDETVDDEAFDAEVAAIGAYEPDVYISMTSGNPCWQVMQSPGWRSVADGIRSRNGLLLMSSACATPNTMHLAGPSADGWYTARGSLTATHDEARANDAFIEFVNERLALTRRDPDHPLYSAAFQLAYPYVEALRIAAELPGGLTRTNLILAVRSLDITHPMLEDGVRLRLNGDNDAFAIEASGFSRYVAAADAWRALGPIIDLEGTTPRCDWNADAAVCR
ncbi:cell wall-binding repeat-containing protein [Candidatus Poriferisodalis sp.]|uniref:cell wall-binding repeat-containing protein n=1 Tax=Candidatus Poriferisodalis sp. TaxID=3101277 RepID=UPI003B02BDD1